MGSGIELKCSKCKRKFKFLEGIGMLDYSQSLMDYESEFNLLRRYEHGIDKWGLRRILKSKEYILDEAYYGYKTYQCPTCKRVSNEFYFKLIALKNDEEDFISEYKCYKCKSKLEILKDDSKCPICGGEFDKEEINIIRWD